MYPQNTKNFSLMVAIYSTKAHCFLLLMTSVLIIATTHSHAETITTGTKKTPPINASKKEGINNPINQLNYNVDQTPLIYDDAVFRLIGHNSTLANTQPDIVFDQDFVFNYLWMQRYQSDRYYKEGGAAAGKLARMGAKVLYKMYTGTLTSNDLENDDLSGPLADMKYRLRMSSDKVKFSIKYDF